MHKAIVKSNRNIFPVLDKKGHALEGILLLDDIRDVMFKQELYKTLKVADFMRSVPDVIVYEEDNVQAVMNKFQLSGAWNLPIIKEGKYIGFVSKSKLLTAYRKKLIDFTK